MSQDPATHDSPASRHADLVRALIVERFSRWTPHVDRGDSDGLTAYPAVRDGMPFQPNARNVRARPYRRATPVRRRQT